MTIVASVEGLDARGVPPIASLDVVGTPGFLPDGRLLVLEHHFNRGRVVVHEFGPEAGRFVKLGNVILKALRGASVGCAICPDGTRVAVGLTAAKIYAWPGGKHRATTAAVQHTLELNTLGFSPSGALLAVADGSHASPRDRTVHVCDAATGATRTAVTTAEWSFVQALLLDDATLVTLGRALDWQTSDPTAWATRVLGCYDVDGGRPRWRRVLRGGQQAGVDGAAGLVWVAGDAAEGGEHDLLGLSARDGQVVRALGFAGGHRPDLARPVPLGSSALVVTVTRGWPRLVVLGVDGRVLANLGGSDRPDGLQYPVAACSTTHRVAAVCGRRTVVWQLP